MRAIRTTLATALLASAFVQAGEPTPAHKLDPALAKKVGASLDKAIAYYRQIQGTDGGFATGDKFDMGITGLAVTGMLRSKRVTTADPMIVKALAHLETFVQPGGGIFPKSLDGQQNYLTSIALMAFVEANKDGKYKTVIDNAAKFLKGEQWNENRTGETKVGPEDHRYGGFGYGSHARPDLSNTSFTLEALMASGASKDDEAVQRAIVFLRRCQNYTGEGGNDKPVGAAADLDGGFAYTPDDSMAGKTPTGGLRSYASMTYAGLKSFIYAGLTLDDPRLKAALEWLRKHYSVTENPGMGQSGLYYYYNTFAKAFSVAKIDKFDSATGARDWRADLIEAITSKQSEDGGWVNPEKRWVEGDKRLATAYAILALAQIEQ
jgi:squalene-hopene/tetraprenyl-beta-curcumene cyclase